VSLLAVGVWALTSCGTVARTVSVPLTIPGASYVGNQACAECHRNLTQVFGASPHGRYHREEGLRMAGQTGCESCHGPGSLHAQAGGGRERLILNPGKDAGACLECHVETHAELRLPHRHPVLEGKLSCVECHDPHGQDLFKAHGGLAMARVNEGCASCHREQARPFVFEHEALREGCTVCHQAHGSVHPALLVQRDVNLCLKCHAQPQAGVGLVNVGKMGFHTDFVRLGTCWTAGCHTAVHGSNLHPKMLY